MINTSANKEQVPQLLKEPKEVSMQTSKLIETHQNVALKSLRHLLRPLGHIMKLTPKHIYVIFRVVFSIVLTYILFRYFGYESGFKILGVFWIITYPVILIVIVGNLLLNFKQVPKALKYYNFLLLLVFLVFPFLPEKMEKGVIFEAHLKEERSSWNIKIFENNNYRVRRSDLGGFRDYEGRYILVNDTLKIERFECNQCNFTNEWILRDKKLIPLNSNSENCYGCFEIVYRK